ncbi:hypothetical protein F511_42247 [Dorcoceras hygrometricum]|uniref:Uncharacterized protein n=1 Tax=Dorcoceras hygrometricum TaxID=472368 RepID=A0A2Z7AYE2_9LAMI|nr:hypothetical protein F511_42247 [Dorcoceras hygrometricum]
MLEQHEDQAQSMKSSLSAESRVELKCRVEVQNAQVQNQRTRVVIECEAIASWIKALWQYSAMKKHPADKNQLGKIS